jgi:hypothetical protein
MECSILEVDWKKLGKPDIQAKLLKCLATRAPLSSWRSVIAQMVTLRCI